MEVTPPELLIELRGPEKYVSLGPPEGTRCRA